MAAAFLKRKGKDQEKAPQEVVIANQKIILNSRGLIPAIIQRVSREQSIVLSLVYMNREALEMSLKSGELYIYRRSKGRIEKAGEDTYSAVPIDTIMVDKNRRVLLVTVTGERGTLPKQTFVQAIYPEEIR
ncbi:MAG: hypothetical protein Kow0042_13560 [Calditrichia bacterium]